jgi:hypothetical protein
VANLGSIKENGMGLGARAVTCAVQTHPALCAQSQPKMFSSDSLFSLLSPSLSIAIFLCLL